MFERSPTLDALQRTTTAPTIIRSGTKDNVIPAYAEAVVNYRIHSKQTCQEVVDYHLRVINDERVQHEVLECVEPSPISPVDSLGFMLIEHSTRQIFEDSIIIPGYYFFLILHVFFS